MGCAEGRTPFFVSR